MNSIYFTSDLHLFHDNIIRFSNRPFKDIAEMNAKLVENWNSVIDRGDTVYFLGDFAFTYTSDQRRVEKYLSRLNGQKHLIIGNHDRDPVVRAKGWAWVGEYKNLKVKDPDSPTGKQKIILFHYAIRSWHHIGRGAWHLYGHSHGNLPNPIGKSFDIGVDDHNFMPWSYDEIKAEMAKKEIFAEDHHSV